MNLSRRALLLGATTSVLRAASPFPANTRPTSHGVISAGEGPVWHPELGLLFTGKGRITRRDPEGAVSVYLDNVGANGLLLDHQGRLNTCEAGRKRVTRTELDGSTTVLADRFEGSRFNSPNDLTVDSKGRVYFSDPRYGSRDGMEMLDDAGSPVEGVYRVDAPGVVRRVITHEVDRPNGLLVSPGDEFLYVADNNNDSVGGARTLWRFDLRSDGSIAPASKKRIFDWGDSRGPDGIEMDQEGRLFVAGGLNEPNPPYETTTKKGGVYVLSAEGELIDFAPVPTDEVTNCAFGGRDWKTLFITAGGELFSIPVSSPGWTPLSVR